MTFDTSSSGIKYQEVGTVHISLSCMLDDHFYLRVGTGSSRWTHHAPFGTEFSIPHDSTKWLDKEEKDFLQEVREKVRGAKCTR
jgi:hypothetical protein